MTVTRTDDHRKVSNKGFIVFIRLGYQEARLVFYFLNIFGTLWQGITIKSALSKCKYSDVIS